jgi:predicted MFS family arabinose efflux permease
MGGILVEFANWHWIFFLITLIAIPIAVICFIFIPPQPIDQTERPNLDVIGISALTGTSPTPCATLMKTSISIYF